VFLVADQYHESTHGQKSTLNRAAIPQWSLESRGFIAWNPNFVLEQFRIGFFARFAGVGRAAGVMGLAFQAGGAGVE
jgi:hypothetical protein